jgi:glycosyltransferase involved in cell wall biosynthesis
VGVGASAARDLSFELVVVDDGSRDATADLLARWRARRFVLRRARQANAGPGPARNRALALARGELVVYTGDDIEPSPSFLAEHWRGHELWAEPLGAIVGLTRWPPEARLTATMVHVDGPGAQQFSYHWFRDGAEYDFRHFYTSNLSVRRALLAREPEGFSPDFPHAAWEDTELGWRLARHGLRIRYRAACLAWHHHPYDVRSFFRRQERCGAMACVLFDKQPALERWLGIAEVEDRRIRSLRLAPAARARIARVAASLEAWEGRWLALAERYDRRPDAPLDRMLHPLFRYAFLKGLAGGLLDPAAARSVGALALLDLLPGALSGLAEEVEAGRLPRPGSGLATLAGLLTPTQQSYI